MRTYMITKQGKPRQKLSIFIQEEGGLDVRDALSKLAELIISEFQVQVAAHLSERSIRTEGQMPIDRLARLVNLAGIAQAKVVYEDPEQYSIRLIKDDVT